MMSTPQIHCFGAVCISCPDDRLAPNLVQKNFNLVVLVMEGDASPVCMLQCGPMSVVPITTL